MMYIFVQFVRNKSNEPCNRPRQEERVKSREIIHFFQCITYAKQNNNQWYEKKENTQTMNDRRTVI